MRYTVNQTFDRIESENKVVVFTGNVDKVFVFNEVEAKILSIFSNVYSIDDAFFEFNNKCDNVIVKKSDFYDFVKHLIEKEILIEIAND